MEAIQTIKLHLPENELFHRILHPSFRMLFEAPRRCGVLLKFVKPCEGSLKGLENLWSTQKASVSQGQLCKYFSNQPGPCSQLNHLVSAPAPALLFQERYPLQARFQKNATVLGVFFSCLEYISKNLDCLLQKKLFALFAYRGQPVSLPL